MVRITTAVLLMLWWAVLTLSAAILVPLAVAGKVLRARGRSCGPIRVPPHLKRQQRTEASQALSTLSPP